MAGLRIKGTPVSLVKDQHQYNLLKKVMYNWRPDKLNGLDREVRVHLIQLIFHRDLRKYLDHN